MLKREVTRLVINSLWYYTWSGMKEDVEYASKSWCAFLYNVDIYYRLLLGTSTAHAQLPDYHKSDTLRYYSSSY